MTPKEALRKIGGLLTQTYTQNGINAIWTSKLVKDSCEYKTIEKALTPPTVEEVCKALSQFYKEQVSYSNDRHNHMFYFEKSRLGIVMLLFENINFIRGDYHKTNNLPPHLITLIGRFYEGLKLPHH